jgi:hypothetical protein
MIILSPALHTEANNSYLQAALNCQTKKENFFKKKKKNILCRQPADCGVASQWEEPTSLT